MRVSGLRSGQTRIPEVPDQTQFLEKWYEFHRGYRISRKEDGSEERVALLGEDFREVSPGCLPRTLEELRSGRRREEEAQQAREQAVHEREETGPSLEDTLEQMFVAASSEDRPEHGHLTEAVATPTPHTQQHVQEMPQPANIHAQAINPLPSRNREYQVRRVAALRRELHRMRNGIERVISGLRDLGEEVPNYTETTGRLNALGQTLDTISGAPSHEEAEQAINSVNALTRSAGTGGVSQSDRTLANIQARVDEARTRMEEARRMRDQTASELDLAEQEFRSSQQRFQQLQREQRSTENYIRIFGTREEMLAQGENYVSPIGNMFSRAYERFHAAEGVRQEERTLRQVLEDEARAGGEEDVRQLAELEGRQRDVWGVPLPNTTTPALDEVPQTANGATPVPDLISNEAGEATVGANEPATYVAAIRVAESGGPWDGVLRAPEDYRPPPRRRDRGVLASGTADRRTVTELDGTSRQANENFPRSMLNSIVAARERELAERSDSPTPEPAQITSSRGEIGLLESSDTHELSTPQFSPDEWWHQDADHVIRSLTTNDVLREVLGMSSQDASALLVYFTDDMISESDRATIDGLLRDPRAIWGTDLPAEWLRRRRELALYNWPREGLYFNGSEDFPGAADWAAHHNPFIRLEVVAQAFQMSSDIRRLAEDCTPPERLQMLYRLQAGQRTQGDLATLERIRDDEEAFHLAHNRYRRTLNLPPRDNEDIARARLDDSRRDIARHGDYSRQELDARRRDTAHTFALAAGRQAMETGSRALLERMAEHDEDTRAAYHRLQANNFMGQARRPTLYRQLTLSDYLEHGSDSNSDSDSEKQDEGPAARGLDARDSGRPEPKSEAEMKVDMECKVCYTQLSEIACLPCGHLVMCRWCSEQHSPCLQHDHTRPRRAAACPVCRKGIRQKVRVFRA